MSKVLNVVSFSGIYPDTLGDYLVGLGLLAASAQQWPAIRGCWRNGSFTLIGDKIERTSIESYLFREWHPAAYERWWEKAYKEDRDSAKKKRPLEATVRLRAQQENTILRSLDATVVTLHRPVNNPIFGNLAGQLGAKRDFSKVQLACLQFLNIARDKALKLDSVAKDLASVLKQLDKNENKVALLCGWLRLTLFAEDCQDVPPIGSAGTWFVYANRTYNSGQDWYREGEISPWSFLLALEGAMMLVGGIDRRLSAKARPYAVFPFVTEASSAASEGEIGLAKAEFWAPLWEQPATLQEIRTLLKRGLARIGERTAKAPHEFAVAALAAGVDAGVTTFARFVLRQTTSSQVYEAIPRERIQVKEVQSQESKMVEPLLPWLDHLPFEVSDSKQRGKFKGLRGPIEQAIINVAAQPEEPERWQGLLSMLADTQRRIDHNKLLRGQCHALPWLDQAWFAKCWPVPPAEMLVARAIASIGATTDEPIIINIYGVEPHKHTNPNFSGEQRPQRVIWHSGQPLRVLADVLERRLIDTDAASPLPLRAKHLCTAEVFAGLMTRGLDFEMIVRWIPPLSLIRWDQQQIIASSAEEITTSSSLDGTSLLHALFRPLFYPGKLRISRENLFPDRLLPRAITARRLLNLIRQGNWDEAIQLACGRYLAAGQTVVKPPSNIHADGELLAAALLTPLQEHVIAAGLRRWLQPKRNNGK